MQLQCGSGIFMAVPVARHTQTRAQAHAHAHRGSISRTHFIFGRTLTDGRLQYGRHLMHTTGTRTPLHRRCAACTDIFSYFALKCALEVFGKAILKSPHTRATLTIFFAVELSFLLTLLLDFAMHTFKMKQKTQSAAAAATFTNMNTHSYTSTQLTHTQDIPQMPLFY